MLAGPPLRLHVEGWSAIRETAENALPLLPIRKHLGVVEQVLPLGQVMGTSTCAIPRKLFWSVTTDRA